MRLIEKYDKGETVESYIDTEERDLDGDPVVVLSANGFGATNISIECGNITWKQLDVLKDAIAFAEKRWRK